jgi:two-component system OmpR family response regulator
MAMRLLLLEDDPLLGEGLRDWLAADGHVVEWCRCLQDTLAMAGEPFDALLVDWQLPDGSGMDWLRGRRSRGDRTPALMLTARDRLTHRIEGLDAGADDYLIKPFAPEELAARLRAGCGAAAGAAGRGRPASQGPAAGPGAGGAGCQKEKSRQGSSVIISFCLVSFIRRRMR